MASHCHLGELPEELILTVLLHHHDQQSLARLARVSKQFDRIMIPELNRHPSLKGRGSTLGVKYLLPFTWRIIKDPILAKSVETFVLLGGFLDHHRDYFLSAIVAISVGFHSPGQTGQKLLWAG